MQIGEAHLFHQLQRIVEHRIRLGGKAGDDISAESHIGAQEPHLVAECNNIGPQVPPLHTLEHHVVTRLQADMQVRHQSRLLGDEAIELVIHFNRIDRTQAQAFEFGH